MGQRVLWSLLIGIIFASEVAWFCPWCTCRLRWSGEDTHHFLDGTDPVCSLDAPRVSSASILGSEWMDRHSIKSFGPLSGPVFTSAFSKTELGQRRARLPASPPTEKATARQVDRLACCTRADNSRAAERDELAPSETKGIAMPFRGRGFLWRDVPRTDRKISTTEQFRTAAAAVCSYEQRGTP